METFDHIVVGAGAMGSATAWQLASRGHNVALIEQFGIAHNKGSSHGVVRIFRFAYRNPLYTHLAIEALPLWRELEAEANEQLLSQIGNLDHGVPKAITEIETSLRNAGREVSRMSPDEAKERWPGMKFNQEIIFSSDGGIVQADGSIRAMVRRFEELGGRLFTNVRVEDIEINGDLATVATAEGTFRTKSVVVCAGPWFEKLVGGKVQLPKIVVDLSQPTHFTPLVSYKDPNLWPAFIHHAKEDAIGSSASGGAYGMYTPGVGFKVGFEEQGHLTDADDRDFSINPVWNENTKNYIREWFPGLDPESADPESCIFTNTLNSDFIIDREGPLTVVSACTGHGFKFTPRIGQIAADLACGGTQTVPEWRFRTS